MSELIYQEQADDIQPESGATIPEVEHASPEEAAQIVEFGGADAGTGSAEPEGEGQPDHNAMRQEIATLKRQLVESYAVAAAKAKGIRASAMPYLFKMADLDKISFKDASEAIEAVNVAVDGVLQAIPELCERVYAGGTGSLGNRPRIPYSGGDGARAQRAISSAISGR